MSTLPVVAIVGATGVIGNELVSLLDNLTLPIGEVRLLASDESAGEVYKVGDDEVMVEELEESTFHGVDYAIFATKAELSEKYIPVARAAGAVCIDTSSVFRLKADVPLLVPECNIQSLPAAPQILACPNPLVLALAGALSPLHAQAGVRRVIVSTYQSVSSAGKAALDELWSQVRAIFSQSEITVEALPQQIAFNCIPQIDTLRSDGYTAEEHSVGEELRKVLNRPQLPVSVTAVRVPVLHGHGMSVSVELERGIDLQSYRSALETERLIHVFPEDDYPMPLTAVSREEVQLGRLRVDRAFEHGVSFWIALDNIRRGAAMNAVNILTALLERRTLS